MLAGETTGGQETSECAECKASLELAVCKSAAGYFIGYWCNAHGPCGRETEYFGTEQEAEDVLESFFADGFLRGKRS